MIKIKIKKILPNFNSIPHESFGTDRTILASKLVVTDLRANTP